MKHTNKWLATRIKALVADLNETEYNNELTTVTGGKPLEALHNRTLHLLFNRYDHIKGR